MSNEDLSILVNKEILITGTAAENDLPFKLAHIIRNYAKRTWCVDPNYKMSQEPNGYRIIEGGKVILVKGNLKNPFNLKERQHVYDIIRSLNGYIDYEIDIKKVRNEK